MSKPVEVSDLIRTWRVDGTRPSVVVEEVVARLEATGQHRAARIVRGLPHHGGVIDDEAVDALMVRVHRELQRLAEELLQGRRVRDQLDPLVRRIGGPVRIVDVGCGIGYTQRWLAAHAGWEDVELVGVDLDATLVAEATRLAEVESLDCRFVVGDAFAPGVAIDDPQRTIVISSGLLHHVPVDGLARLFGVQEALGVAAFAHWDPAPGPWSTFGAWIFHRARMRDPLSRHDGVLSVRRAHPAAVLADAARAGAPSYDVSVAADPGWLSSLAEIVRPVVGVRR